MREKLKSHGSILFESLRLNLAAGSDTPWVCVDLAGSTPKGLNPLGLGFKLHLAPTGSR